MFRNIFFTEKEGEKVGFGAGFVIPRNGSEDPDPYQNETDPKHWYKYIKLKEGWKGIVG